MLAVLIRSFVDRHPLIHYLVSVRIGIVFLDCVFRRFAEKATNDVTDKFHTLKF